MIEFLNAFSPEIVHTASFGGDVKLLVPGDFLYNIIGLTIC